MLGYRKGVLRHRHSFFGRRCQRRWFPKGRRCHEGPGRLVVVVSQELSSSKRQPYMARIDFVYSSCSCISSWIKFRFSICRSCLIHFMHRSLVSCSHFTRRHLSQVRTGIDTEGLLQRLAANKELDAEDAKNELRWMRQSLPNGDREELASLVERRAKGEPLQFILGMSDSTSCSDARLHRLWPIDTQMSSSNANSPTRNRGNLQTPSFPAVTWKQNPFSSPQCRRSMYRIGTHSPTPPSSPGQSRTGEGL
jgi:hypothetical protein